jgi:PhzF family phenazine biosynthesis protein
LNDVTTMKTRPFQQVDVFTAVPYRGNPLAVVLDGTDLDDAELQRFAQWTNLSETTFLLPPTDPAADYRVRIFTPGSESGDRIVQQSAVGLVPIRRDGERLAFAAPPVTRSAPSPSVLARVAAALGLKAAQIRGAQMLDNGPVWMGLLLDDVDTVLALKPDHRALKELRQKVGVAAVPNVADAAPALIGRSNREARAFGARAQPAPVGLEVRAFAAPIGVEEDPVTGSFNASIAQWLIADGHVPERYVAGQGQCMGRDGRVHIERDADGQVWVGGDAVTCIEGSVHL